MEAPLKIALGCVCVYTYVVRTGWIKGTVKLVPWGRLVIAHTPAG